MTANPTRAKAITGKWGNDRESITPQPVPADGQLQATQSPSYVATVKPIIKRWDNEAVVYHPASSNTYVLDEFALVLIEQLGQGKMTFEQLKGFIHTSFELEGETRLEPALRQKLRELMRLDFIEIEEPCA